MKTTATHVQIVNKEVGTELCILYNATNQLRRALQYEELEAK